MESSEAWSAEPQQHEAQDSRHEILEGSVHGESDLAPFRRAGYHGGMSPMPPIPRDLRDQTPPDVQAAVLAPVQSFERRIAAPEARLGQDSTNSSRSPSSDPIHLKLRPPRPPSGMKRGGQPGRKRHSRGLVSPERLTDVLGFLTEPTACVRGWTARPPRRSRADRHPTTSRGRRRPRGGKLSKTPICPRDQPSQRPRR